MIPNPFDKYATDSANLFDTRTGARFAQELMDALIETTKELAELIKGEKDDPDTGIVGWHGLHVLVADNRDLIERAIDVATDPGVR